MLKFNLLKTDKPYNTLKELLNMWCDNVLYLTREDLNNSSKYNNILDIDINNFIFFPILTESLYNANFIIFVDGDMCKIIKNRYGEIGIYCTEPIINTLTYGTHDHQVLKYMKKN